MMSKDAPFQSEQTALHLGLTGAVHMALTSACQAAVVRF